LEGFCLRDFELYLLYTTREPLANVPHILDGIGVNQGEMARRGQAVSRMLYPGRSDHTWLMEVLSPALVGDLGPDESHLYDRFRMLEHPKLYRLPLWPDFGFAVHFVDMRVSYWGGEFDRRLGENVRPPGEPLIGNLLRVEMLEEFSEVEELEAWGHYRAYSGTGRDGRRYSLGFWWGLLQGCSVLE
jgi:hypothetical protein